MEIGFSGEVSASTTPVEGSPRDIRAPGWLPDEIQGRMERYEPKVWGHISEDLSRSFKRYGVDILINAFYTRPLNEKSWSEKEKERVLGFLGIGRDELDNYVDVRRNYWNNENDFKAKSDYDEAEKAMFTKIWEVTSAAWERERPRREKEMERWSRIEAAGNTVAANKLRSIEMGIARFKEDLLGIRRSNDMLYRLFGIPGAVEARFKTYDNFLIKQNG